MQVAYTELIFWASVTFATPLVIALLPLIRVRLTERTLHLMLGLSAGILGGVTFFNILPEAFALASTPVFVALGVGFGFFLLLSVERYLLSAEEAHGGHFHIHEERILDSRHGPIGVGALMIHGFMDGFVIPVGFQAGPQVGIVVTLAVAIHQIPDSFAALSLALGSTRSRRQAASYVLATALDTPLGILLGVFFIGLGDFLIPVGLGLTAGTFIYISAVDLVPELQHKARGPLVVISMILGFLLVGLLSTFLPEL